MATAGSVREALAAAVDAMAAAGVDTPRLDAELLLAEATGWQRARLAADPDAAVRADAGRRFGEMVRRRLRREPVAYILGRKGFRHIDLAVDRRVLIPRPETELLVELALELEPETVLDVGTGSGAIALAVAEEMPACKVTATDTSPAALEVARGNAERLGLAERVSFQRGSVPEGRSFDLILANLPYVSEANWPSLQPEVTEWEPRAALLAGGDGLDAIQAFLDDCGRIYRRYPKENTTSSGGVGGGGDFRALAMEVGEGQAPAVALLMGDAGFASVRTHVDLAGIERVVVGAR